MTYKHRDIVIAYMDGAEIEVKDTDGRWRPMSKFNKEEGISAFFLEQKDYRIKPTPVLIRHYSLGGGHVYVAAKNYSPLADSHAASHEIEEDNHNLKWLDDWHEAKFSAMES